MVTTTSSIYRWRRGQSIREREQSRGSNKQTNHEDGEGDEATVGQPIYDDGQGPSVCAHTSSQRGSIEKNTGENVKRKK